MKFCAGRPPGGGSTLRKSGPSSIPMLMMDFKASNIATIDKGSDRTFASAFFHPPASPTHVGCCVLNRAPARPPSEIYFESRGKCCKKLLRYNGYPNKVLLYPEEGWARSAASSYWTIAPCRWRRNRCIVEEVAGSRNGSEVLGVCTALDEDAFRYHVPDRTSDSFHRKPKLAPFEKPPPSVDGGGDNGFNLSTDEH
uniref:Uncharacterized protein n=1 Tax=Anopheles coluzzii TaxID=1518534 RepID=A0A8W7PHF1_ANOCL